MGAAHQIAASVLPQPTANREGDGPQWRLRTSGHIVDLTCVLYYVGEAEITGAIVLSPDPDHARSYATLRAAHRARSLLAALVPLVLERVPETERRVP